MVENDGSEIPVTPSIKKSEARKKESYKLWLSVTAIAVVALTLLLLNLSESTLFPLSLKAQDWTGFGGGTIEKATTSTEMAPDGKILKTVVTNKKEDGKTLWDWLSVLGVPLTLALLGGWFQTRQQTQANKKADLEKEIAETARKEEVIQAYLDKLSELVVDKNLFAIAAKVKRSETKSTPKKEGSGDSSEDLEKKVKLPEGLQEQKEQLDAAVDVIRARTLAVLRRLKDDPERKSSVMEFLIEAEVIQRLDLSLRGADLGAANLGGAYLRGAYLRGAYLRGADLGAANLGGADLGDANLSGANLSGANLSGADLRDANFSGASLLIADLGDADLGGADLGGADLSRANLSRANLFFADFSGANLRDANFSGADFSGAKLRGAKLRGADLHEFDLGGADFSGADLRTANLSHANLSHANLRGADLRGADLRGADLSGANLSGANLRSAKLSGANLRSADLRSAYLSGTDLRSAYLSGTDLRGAVLLRFDLQKAKDLTQNQLEGEDPPLLCHVTLPIGIGVDPNRDCEKIPQALLNKFPKEFKDLAAVQAYMDEHSKL